MKITNFIFTLIFAAVAGINFGLYFNSVGIALGVYSTLLALYYIREK